MKPLDVVILAGGKGTRIRKFLKDKPKPLAKFGRYYFLDLLINNLSKYDIGTIHIIAGYKGSLILKKYHKKKINFVNINCIVEKKPLGTGGALSLIKNKISKNFFLFNGDTIIDFNFYEMLKLKKKGHHVMTLVKSKFNKKGNKIQNLSIDKKNIIKQTSHKSRKIFKNAGAYLLDKSIFKYISNKFISLENEILNNLISKKKIFGLNKNCFFYDIGTKKDYKNAKNVLLKHFKKPALFLDRDNTINKDSGYTHKYEDFKFINNSIAALKYATKKNYYIFLVTNQAGIAKGYYTVDHFESLHKKLKKYFLKNDILINDVKFCPYHPKAKIKKYKKNSRLRKPGNLMIRQLLNNWVIDKNKSKMIGDSLIDKKCAKNSGIKFQFVKSDLKKQIENIDNF